MLPILRILPVGGVILAIVILLLALIPPGASHVSPPTAVIARGPLLDRDTHPEWRQFLILAAFQRADELSRLRELPDTPVITVPPMVEEPTAPAPTEAAEPAAAEAAATNKVEPVVAPAEKPKDVPNIIAGLPVNRGAADPDADDVTGSIEETPGATIPVDIGEASSTELPVAMPEEKPPVVRTPERTKPPRESRRKAHRHAHRAKVQARPAPPPRRLSFFEILFGPFVAQTPREHGAPEHGANDNRAQYDYRTQYYEAANTVAQVSAARR